MHRLRCPVVIGALTAALCVLAAGPAAAAKGGNNETAKACQHGGWTALGTFANQGDCVNDGAQATPPFSDAHGSQTCPALGGTFSADAPDTNSWTCEFNNTPSNWSPLIAACRADGGELDASSGDRFAVCNWRGP